MLIQNTSTKGLLYYNTNSQITITKKLTYIQIALQNRMIKVIHNWQNSTLGTRADEVKHTRTIWTEMVQNSLSLCLIGPTDWLRLMIGREFQSLGTQ